MIQKFKNSLLVIVGALALLSPAILPTSVSYAASNCTGVPNKVAGGADAATGNQNTVSCGDFNSATAETGLGNLAQTIVNIFSIIVGAAAIIMIIYAGFRYITSGGSSERIGNAKTTLIYAIIGLVVVALAQILVRFVLSASTSAGATL